MSIAKAMDKKKEGDNPQDMFGEYYMSNLDMQADMVKLKQDKYKLMELNKKIGGERQQLEEMRGRLKQLQMRQGGAGRGAASIGGPQGPMIYDMMQKMRGR